MRSSNPTCDGQLEGSMYSDDEQLVSVEKRKRIEKLMAHTIVISG